jgi:hypothetical protein
MVLSMVLGQVVLEDKTKLRKALKRREAKKKKSVATWSKVCSTSHMLNLTHA